MKLREITHFLERKKNKNKIVYTASHTVGGLSLWDSREVSISKHFQNIFKYKYARESSSLVFLFFWKRNNSYSINK